MCWREVYRKGRFSIRFGSEGFVVLGEDGEVFGVGVEAAVVVAGHFVDETEGFELAEGVVHGGGGGMDDLGGFCGG